MTWSRVRLPRTWPMALFDDLSDALSAALSDPVFSVKSSRNERALEQCRNLREKLSLAEFSDLSRAFSQQLSDSLKRVFVVAERCSGKKALSRERLWREFHLARLTALEEIWAAFLSNGRAELDPLVQQYINEKFLKSLLTSICREEGHSSSACRPAPRDTLTKEEENIIRYAAGFVPFSLLKKYRRINSDKAALFCECLSRMVIEGDEESFLEYTRNWTKAVNRGGLFEISDSAYVFFREIENVTRAILASTLASRPVNSSNQEKMISVACEDENVLRFWEALAADLDDGSNEELLRQIVQQWLTIRRFSIAGKWKEIYKERKQGTAKSASLRQSLKKD